MNPVISVSYSKYSTWQQCPKKFEYLYIHKLKEAPSEILERGTRLHKEVEEFIKLADMPCPDCAKPFEKYLTEIKPKAVSEEFWQCDENFEPTAPFSPATRMVGKVDIYTIKGNTLYIIDIKTGKVRDKQIDQLELYGLMGFKKFDFVDTVVLKLLYLDSGVEVEHTFTKSQEPLLLKMWQARLRPFKEALEFPANPTALCGWCSFSKNHFDGPCYDG